MKVLTVVTFVACFLFSAWFLFATPARTARASVGPDAALTPTPSPRPFAGFRTLLFADQSLEEVTTQMKPKTAGDPWSLFASSLAASREGHLETARKDLEQAIAVSQGETRVALLAWNALRELGELPPPIVADQVQGVVCELHNDAGIETIAAYADGRARWFGQATFVVWESPNRDRDLRIRITGLLKSAEPLVKRTPVSSRRKTTEPQLNYFRVSVLTYSGLYVFDVFSPELSEGHSMTPLFNATVELRDALVKKTQQ